MEDDFVHNNPRDGTKERFARLEEQVVNISCNMALVMESLANDFSPFEEVVGSNLEVGSNENLGDSEDP